ncbi:MAG: hypothetical protein ACK526_20085 [Planctomyces sp.]|jgi:hypothetical protein
MDVALSDWRNGGFEGCMVASILCYVKGLSGFCGNLFGVAKLNVGCLVISHTETVLRLALIFSIRKIASYNVSVIGTCTSLPDSVTNAGNARHQDLREFFDLNAENNGDIRKTTGTSKVPVWRNIEMI